MLIKQRQKSIGSAFLVGMFAASIFAGCATISVYDATSYKNATDLKAESLLLVQKAIEPPDKHLDEVNKVEIELQQAMEYEKGKGNLNNLTVRQWQLLASPDGHLLAGFLKKWQTEGKAFPQVFVDGAARNISDAFDEIIKLEQHKVKK